MPGFGSLTGTSGGGSGGGVNRGYTATITIRIIDGKATRPLRRVGRQVDRTGKKINRFNRRSGFLARTWNTMRKALLSMVGVLIAFNFVITAPQLAMKVLIGLFKESIKLASDFEQKIISLQAVFASKISFKADPFANFKETGKIAENVLNQIALRAGETIGSISDVALVIQTAIASGAENQVRSVKELIDLSILLTNAIATFTPGQDLQRQLSEETRSLFLGRARATSQLVNFLFAGNKNAIRKFLEETKVSGDFLERIEKKLKGVDFASKRLGRTVSGVSATFQSILQIVAHRALSGGGPLSELTERFADFLDDIVAGVEGLNRLAASISASFALIRDAILEVTGATKYLDDSKTVIELLVTLIPLFTEKIVQLVFSAKTGVLVFYELYQLFFNVGRAFGALFQAIASTGFSDFLIGLLENIIIFVHKALAVFAIIPDIVDTIQAKLLGLTKGIINLAIVLSKIPGTRAFVDPLLALASQFEKGNVIDRIFDVMTRNVAVSETGGGPLVSGFKTILDELKSATLRIPKIMKLLFTGPLSSDVAKTKMDAFAKAFEDAFKRIEDRMKETAKAADAIPQKKFLDFSGLLEENKNLLKSTGFLRTQAGQVGKILARSFEGIIPQDIVRKILPDVDIIIGSIQDKIRLLTIQLSDTTEALEAADFLPEFLKDPDQVQKLQDDATKIRGEIAALTGELSSLEQALVELSKTTFVDFAESINNILRANVFSAIRTQIQEMNEELDKSGGKMNKYAEHIGEALPKLMSVRSEAEHIGFSFRETFKNIKEMFLSTEGLTALLGAAGNAMAQAVTQAIKGAESFGEALKGIFGTVLIAIGQAALATGTALAIFGAFSMNAAMVQEGLILIAIGVAAIAAGVALSPGSSGSAGSGSAASNENMPEFMHSQQSIAAQQYFNSATENLRVSSENIDSATQNIKGVKAGEVFMKGATEVGGVTKVLAGDARRGDSFGAARDSALAFQGM